MTTSSEVDISVNQPASSKGASGAHGSAQPASKNANQGIAKAKGGLQRRYMYGLSTHEISI